MKAFNISIYHSDDDPWQGDIFLEVAESIRYGLQELGYAVSLHKGTVFIQNGTNILLGYFNAPLALINALPENCIYINTEQLDSFSNIGYGHYAHWKATALRLAERFEVWDYNTKNIIFWEKLGKQAKYLRLGYQKHLCRIEPQTKEIDILFYGSLNERRKRILRALADKGLKVVYCNVPNVKERDRYIAKSKIVLNIHFFDAKIFEVVRCFYLMNNGVAIVSELNDDTTIDEMYYKGIAGVPYDKLVDKCVELLNDYPKRKALEVQALHNIMQYPQSELLKEIL